MWDFTFDKKFPPSITSNARYMDLWTLESTYLNKSLVRDRNTYGESTRARASADELQNNAKTKHEFIYGAVYLFRMEFIFLSGQAVKRDI